MSPSIIESRMDASGSNNQAVDGSEIVNSKENVQQRETLNALNNGEEPPSLAPIPTSPPAQAVAAINPDEQASQQRLKFLLEKSSIYAKLVGDRMERQRQQKAKQEQKAATRKENKEIRSAADEGMGKKTRSTRANAAAATPAVHEEAAEEKPSVKRRRTTRGKAVPVESEQFYDKAAVKEETSTADAAPTDAQNATAQTDKIYMGKQPALITGATLRDYQLAGVQWMVSLYENGLNGILADEMGLGKTIQTISFLAHLMAMNAPGPYLIVCPLSVLANWVTEFSKFAPEIPVLMYHGSIPDRQVLREERMDPSIVNQQNKRKKIEGSNANIPSFPVIVTTYEMIIKDQQYLSRYDWKFIVVDEGHRLKNLNSKLIQELKTYRSANRLLLTGTPLHNNLTELWSLLNFILPEVFDDLTTFQQWFDFDNLRENGDTSGLGKGDIVGTLHEILKPFLLRRLKVDVEPNMPPKKEYLLKAPLTQQQAEIYKAIVNHEIRDYLIEKMSGISSHEPSPAPSNDTANFTDTGNETAGTETDGTRRSSRRLAKQPKLNYRVANDDERFAQRIEAGLPVELKSIEVPEKTVEETSRDWAVRHATKKVNNMRLQNLIMQLRKVSSHPFLFDWPMDERTGDLVINDDLVNASGKMLLLNRLLDALFDRGHKVLIFSQFTTMLDVIEDWATEFKGWPIYRIDGSTKQPDRLRQMNDFNNAGDSPDAVKLFLLSTRAGGLGVNLVAADTVIFFDQDWNPQADLQAADRAHRIGQTKPVLVFRLVTAHTIESRILAKASNKRKLEALVISRGKFGAVDKEGKILLGREKKQPKTEDWAKELLALDSEEITFVTKDDKVISDEDLEILLDRSPAALAREKGWSAGMGAKGQTDEHIKEKINKGEKTAFEVFVPNTEDDANNELANMFTEKGAE
ncbi:hypothetical protein QFC21_005335 [Naganishia friedmannii]|uniref:Uncharacterized protein n=1 Tax=Naganishia friedmannii TaxID=89922 RepID=A0ACC2VA68_9TREE|nr:hypothetical protein QFC21_005335 [Naganishia friedmannii]